MAEPERIWAGREVAVLCSGPSLTEADARAVAHLPRVVTNTTFRIAPDADCLFAYDAAWWAAHSAEVNAIFSGRRYAYAYEARKYGAIPLDNTPNFRTFGNSGACAVALAALLGARRVLLLGADCFVGERAHWHGDHPKPLTNAGSWKVWPRQFKLAGDFARHNRTEVINCSRETALECFPRAKLEDALC